MRTRWPEFVLAIDQGTSATKAVVVDRQGKVAAFASVPLGLRHPRPGWAEQDPAEIWQSVRQAVRQVLGEVVPGQVAAVGLSVQRESILLWDRATGEPLGPVLGWQDTRGAALCANLRAQGHDARVRSLTGLPLDAMFSASKAAALLDQHDPDRSRSRNGELCLGTVDSWLLWKLGGQHLTESGSAARTQLLDITSREWDPWLLDRFGIPKAALPRIVSSVGPFTGSAGLDPLPPEVPVTAVLGDSHAALFAHAGWHPGQVKVTYGTGSSVMGVTTRTESPPDGVVRTIAWELDGPAYALEGNIRSSGATLAWLARLLGTSPVYVAREAAEDSEGVVLVPAFTGLGAPWWDDQARALVTGLNERSTSAHLARAGLESIAFQVEDVVAAFEQGGVPVSVILADGGPSANEVLMQLQADTSGREVVSSEVAELSALGAAHLAGLGAGFWSWSDLEDLPRARRAYAPVSTPRVRVERLKRWHAAVAVSRDLQQRNGGGRNDIA
jgi:glycerol kinase